ncbi:hypothetical protein GQ42DRAFT_161274 [Ramicandelaber brevisporus]|nr:hypothetical protein GQ42DRAFT_161274 [Ramicandelaber brevisporus]
MEEDLRAEELAEREVEIDKVEYERRRSYILSLCTALGSKEPVTDSATGITSTQYVPGDECLECLKDLKRSFRDDELNGVHWVLEWLSQWGTLRGDLIPIFLMYCDKLEDAGTGQLSKFALKHCTLCLELFVVMTWALSEDKQWGGSLGGDIWRWHRYSLREYKQELSSPVVIRSILKLMVIALSDITTYSKKNNKDDDENDENEEESVADRVNAKERQQIVERAGSVMFCVLHLLRNIVIVPNATALGTASSRQIAQTRLQEQLVAGLVQEGFFDLVLVICSNSANEAFAPHNPTVLEILHGIFHHMPLSDLFKNKNNNNGNDTQSTSGTRSALAEALNYQPESALTAINNMLNETDSLSASASTPMSSYSSALSAAAATKSSVSHRSRAQILNTRHSRFGAVFAVNVNGTASIPFSSAREAATASLDQIVGRSKRELFFANKPRKPPSALELNIEDSAVLLSLQTFIGDFMSGCFAPFFTTLFKDIQREKSYIKQQDHIRFTQMTAVFVEAFVNLHELDSELYSWDLISPVLDLRIVGFVLQHVQQASDEKRWIDFTPAVNCFKAIMSLLRQLSSINRESNNNNDKNNKESQYYDAAQHILSNLFYDGTVLNIVQQIASDEKNAKLASIEQEVAVVEAVQMFMKALEQYVKLRGQVMIRKKARRKQQRKKKASNKMNEKGDDVNSDNENDNENDKDNDKDATNIIEDKNEEEAEAEEQERYVEQSMQFESCEMQFAKDTVVRRYCLLLECLELLPVSAIKAVTRMLHRIVVKCGCVAMFFKMSIMERFDRVIQYCDPLNLKRLALLDDDRKSALSELHTVLEYIVRAFLKALAMDPWLIATSFFPRTTAKMRNTVRETIAGSSSKDSTGGDNSSNNVHGEDQADGPINPHLVDDDNGSDNGDDDGVDSVDALLKDIRERAARDGVATGVSDSDDGSNSNADSDSDSDKFGANDGSGSDTGSNKRRKKKKVKKSKTNATPKNKKSKKRTAATKKTASKNSDGRVARRDKRMEILLPESDMTSSEDENEPNEEVKKVLSRQARPRPKPTPSGGGARVPQFSDDDEEDNPDGFTSSLGTLSSAAPAPESSTTESRNVIDSDESDSAQVQLLAPAPARRKLMPRRELQSSSPVQLPIQDSDNDDTDNDDNNLITGNIGTVNAAPISIAPSSGKRLGLMNLTDSEDDD